MLGHRRGHRGACRGELVRVNAGQVGCGRAESHLGGDRGGDVACQSVREEGARQALDDCAPEQPCRARCGQQRGYAPGAGRFAEDGDLVGVAAERLDVLLHPFEDGDLVEQAAVGWRPRDLGEPFHPLAVVERDDHQ